jgi:tape measure domain-containing protein
MAAEDYSIRINVDSSSATQAQRNLQNLNSTVNQAERNLNNTSSAARSAAASLSGLGSSSAGIHSMTAAMSSYAQSATQAANNTQSATREISQMGTAATRTSESMRSISNAIGLIGLGAFAKNVLNTNIEMENLRARLDATFGSMAKGQQAFNDILQIAKETPQSVNEISKSFVMLKNFGIEPTMKVMQDLTNMTSKVGGNADTLSGIVRGLGQAYAKGKLQAEEANQMIERGVPVYALLSKELHKTTAEIMDMMSSGELTRPVIEKLIAAMGSSSVGASTKMMETLGGKISMLGDSWTQFENTLLNDKSEGLIKRIVTGWMAILDGFNAKMNQSISGQIVDLNEKLKAAENRKSFLSKGMESLGVIDSPNKIRSQIIELKQKRLADFQANRQYEQSQKQEKATQAEADAIAKKTKANDEFIKKFGTASQREKQEIEELKKSMGELTKEQLAQVHAKYFAKEASAAKSAAHKEENAALREAKKQQDEYNRLIESTPYGEYNAQVDKLTNALKNGGINQQTYSTLLASANETLLNSTDYVKEHAKALDEQARATERAFQATARGKFEKGYSDLMTQKPFMSETEYSTGQDKLTTDYLKQTQGADFKTPAEQGKIALKAFNDEMDKSAKAFENLGNSGSMVFDGLLGGVSAIAGAIGSFSGEMTKLNDGFESASKSYQDLMMQQGVSLEEKEKATADYYKLKDKYESASFKAEISGARQIAGATAKLFGEKSAARKAFHAIEMGLSVIEMAMAAKKMIVDVAAGAANMFAQGGFAGFAGVAAMAAVMGGLGFAMSGSSKTVDNTTPATKATGTILGDNNATSNSIENIVKTLNDIHAQEYPELKAMADNFRGLDRNMYKLQQQMARATVNFTNMQGMGIPSQATGGDSKFSGKDAVGIAISGAQGGISGAMIGGIGAGLGVIGGLVLGGLVYGLGKFLGIGKTKITQIGEGIVINSGKLLEDGMTTAVDAQTWRKDSAKTRGWLGSKTRIIETYGQLSDEIAGTLQGVSDSLTSGMLSVADNLNVLDVLMYKFTDVASRPFLKIDFFKDGKRVDDTNKVLTDQINAWADRTAKNVFGILFGEYQKLNEGMMETVARLAIQVAGVRGAYTKLGFDLGKTNLGLVHFSDTMAQIFQSSAKADDGLKNFIAGMNEVYEFATNQGQKSQLGFTKGEQALKDLGLNVDITDTAAVKTAMLQLSEMSAKTIAETTAAQDAIRKLKEPVEAYNNPQLAVGTTMEELFKAIGGNRGDWETVFGKDLNKASWNTSKWDMATFEKLDAKWLAVADYFDSIDAVIEGAAAAGGASIDLKSLRSQIAAADAEIEALGILAAKQVDATQYLKENEKTMSKLSSLQDEYLKKTLSAEQFLKIERERIIKEQYDDLEINTADFANLSEITNAMIKAGFEGVTKETQITASQLQRFVWTLEDADKALKKLSEGGKYLMDFSRSIDAWIRNLRATQLGTPESQLKASQANFGEQMKLAQFGSTAEIKRQALSGITGYADTYINALRNYYASSEEGVNAIEQVIKEVSGLEKGLSIQELQLNKLQDIKDAIDVSAIEIPKGISAESAKLFGDLLAQTKELGAETKANPTVENTLKYDAFASIVLAIDKSAKSGADSQFIDKLILSAAGEKGLTANIGLIVDSAEFSLSQKESIINGVLAEFNSKTITFDKFEFNASEAIAAEVERVNNAWLKVELPTAVTDNAKTSVIGLTGGLKDLNGEYDVVITKTTDTGKKIVDFSNTANNTKFGLNQESVDGTIASFKQITDSANAAKAAMDSLAIVGLSDEQTLKSSVYAGTTNNTSITPVAPAGLSTGESALARTYNNQQLLYWAEYQKDEYLLDRIEKQLSTQNVKTLKFLPNGMPEYTLEKFAKGGISNKPAIFGEAGAEAAVPLPDGRSIPVTLFNAANDSSTDNAETVAELKEISRKQEIMINTLIAAAQENRKQNETLVTEIEGLRTDTRLRRAA